jgi:mono/diheme cytochrome c family protein
MRFTTSCCRMSITLLSKPVFLLLPVMALLACGAAMAQSSSTATSNVGRPATAEEIRTWNNLVGPKGEELPIGSGTAVEGARIFASKCQICHGPNGEGGVPMEFGATYPRLVGGVGSLNTPKPVFTPGSRMAYATTLFDYIQRAMPVWPLPRDLKPDNVYALTAFILYRNGIIKEADAMNKATLAEVQMPNRHGFYPDPPQAEPNDKDGTWLPLWEHGPDWKPTTKPGDKYYGPPMAAPK